MTLALRICLSGVLLILVGLNVDWIAIGELAAKLRFESVGIIVVLVLIERLLASYRWYSLLRIANVDIGYLEVTKLTYSTTFVGFFLPGGGGTEALRVFGLGRALGDVPQALASIIAERIVAVAALGCLTAIGLFLARTVIPIEIAISTMVAILILGAALGMLIYEKPQRLFIRILGRSPLAGALVPAKRTFSALSAYGTQPRSLAQSFLVALLFQLSRIAQVVAGAWGLNLMIPIWQILAFMPVIIFLTLLPISVAAGLGVREAAFVFFFGLVGVEPAAAFSLSLYVYVVSFLTGLPGAYLYASRGFLVKLKEPRGDSYRKAGDNKS